ncbi:hypothetical protein ACJX0J_033391, partial [Zea mays]
HASEVFGEKAILTTEARELQSRLQWLSDERNKYLVIIEEVYFEESRKLQKEAEENLKINLLYLRAVSLIKHNVTRNFNLSRGLVKDSI